MRTTRVLWWGGAALLVGGTVLLLRDRSAALPEPPPVAPRVEVGEGAPGAAAPRVAPVVGMARAGVEAGEAGACREQVARLQQEVQALRADLDRWLPPRERFERGGEADPKSEHRLREELTRIWGADAGVSSFDVECRSRTCKVTVLAPPGVHGFERVLQRDERLQRLSRGLSMTGALPVTDPVSGVPYHESSYFLSLRDEEAPHGMELVNKVLGAFHAEGAWERCTRGYRETGTVEVRLALLQPRFELHVGGTLGATPVGRCVRERLEAHARSIEVPASFTGGVRYVTLRSPPE